MKSFFVFVEKVRLFSHSGSKAVVAAGKLDTFLLIFFSVRSVKYDYIFLWEKQYDLKSLQSTFFTKKIFIPFFPREEANLAATCFYFREGKDDSKVILEDKDVEVIGSASVFYDDLAVIAQHIETGYGNKSIST